MSIKFCGRRGPPKGIENARSVEDMRPIKPLFSMAFLTSLNVVNDIGAPFIGGLL